MYDLILKVLKKKDINSVSKDGKLHLKFDLVYDKMLITDYDVEYGFSSHNEMLSYINQLNMEAQQKGVKIEEEIENNMITLCIYI